MYGEGYVTTYVNVVIQNIFSLCIDTICKRIVTLQMLPYILFINKTMVSYMENKHKYTFYV